tara:strand:- start:2285 stop:2542 length:258 start_codon:yes stop_codon:yes gene_type:complete
MSLLRLPEEHEFRGWLDDPVTKAVFELLRKGIAGRKEQWTRGDFEDVSQFATAIKGSRAIGNCEALQSILDLEYEQLIGEMSDEK